MGLTDLTIRLLLLFLPGIVCFLIVEALTVHQERKTHEVLFFSYIYGALAYCIYGLVRLLIGLRYADGLYLADGWEPAILASLTDPNVKLNFREIAWVTLAAVVLAFLLSLCDTRKWLHKIAYRLRCTNKFGELDVWNFAFNLDDTKWCVVRDIPNKIMYQGFIRAFSDVGDRVELLLMQVIVYNESTSQVLYQADRMYLARKKDDLTIEFQQPPELKEPANGEQAAKTNDNEKPTNDQQSAAGSTAP